MKNNGFNLKDFLPSKLASNQLRSVYGGGSDTDLEVDDDPCAGSDHVYDDGSTSWSSGSQSGCNECDFTNCE